MNEISVSDRKSTNNIAEFSIKDEKNYIVNVRKCFFITPDMKYASMRALSIFEDWGCVWAFYYSVHKPRARHPRSQWLRDKGGDGGVRRLIKRPSEHHCCEG